MKSLSIIASLSLMGQVTPSISQPVPAPPTVAPTLPEWSALKSACVTPGPSTLPPIADTISQTAVEEAVKFGEQKSVEGTWAILKGADFERAENSFAWGRVYHYWKTAGALKLWKVRSPKISAMGDPVLQGKDLEWDSDFDLARTFANLDAARKMSGSPLTKWEAFTLQAETVIPRVVQNDLPWSAVFISTVMAQSGLSKQQFQLSSRHVDYIQHALRGLKGAAPNTAYVACPPDADVVLKVGDLICATREKGRISGFQDVWDNRISASHCDIVVALGMKSGRAIVSAVGGNVSNSVLTKKLGSSNAVPSLATIAPPTCEGGAEPCEWIAVLKLRQNL